MNIPKQMTKELHPRCATCGHQDCFEHNEDHSYIKCLSCGREYFGGKDELLEYNHELIEETKEELASELHDILRKELRNILKRIK